MKLKLLSCAGILTLLLASSAYAGDMSVTFDRALNEITMQGTQSAQAVTVTVAKSSSGTLGADYMPEYISVLKLTDGTIDKKVKLRADIESGKYFVYFDGEGVHDSSAVMIVNSADEGTQAVISEINSAQSANELYKLLFSERAEKIGVDLDDDFISEKLEYIAKQCFGAAGKYDVNSFCTAFEEAVACAMLSDEDISVNEAMLKYAQCFGTTYDEYIKSDGRDILDELLKSADFSNGSPAEIYAEKADVAKVRASKTWSYLQENVTAIADKADIDISSGSAYGKISSSDRYKVFVAMFKVRDNFTSYADIKESFDKAVSENKSSKGNQGGGSGGSGGSSGSKSGGIGVIGAAEPEKQPQPTENKHKFSDMANHWSREYVDKLASRGIISGYEDNSFKPESSVTRAEFVKLLTELFNIKSDKKAEFTDVSENDWYFSCISNAEKIVSGYDGRFMPNSPITRQDAAVIVYRLGKFAGGESAEFYDFGEVSDYAKEAVCALSKAGVMIGDGGYFRPQSEIKRGEAAALLYNAEVKGE